MSEVHELKAKNEKLKAEIKKMNDILCDIFGSQEDMDVDGANVLLYQKDEEHAQKVYGALKKLEVVNLELTLIGKESARNRPKVESSSAASLIERVSSFQLPRKRGAPHSHSSLIENEECECALCLEDKGVNLDKVQRYDMFCSRYC
jgi:hypothetical protein